ncbi:molybdopterin-dependent oxidoreductase [Nitratireductor luteus]|uniref:molybdopterin-dependent oxidoreductase n=1 Tax=Nitratireductor luteus TaxID=2976980 RepID=UPI00223EC54E|nr:molybdopterin-dependent oxidoreductase [Nitratireductor luteus]
MIKLLYAVFVSSLLLAAPLTAAAEDAVVLTIDGAIEGGSIDYTLEELEQMPSATIATSMPWEDGVVSFEGVPMAALMEAVGAKGGTARVLALNNYVTEIPFVDFNDYGVILAFRRNGDHMPIADKGPLFVVYPFDDRPMLKDELYHARSAWQVRRITVTP